MSKVRLGDVTVECRETCTRDKSDYPIVGLEHITPEDVALTKWSEPVETSFSKLFKKGDVLFGRRRAYLKKAAMAPFDGICSGDITVIRSDPEKVNPDLLPFIIQNDDLFDFAVGRSAGSLSPRVKWEHLKNYPFFLPELDEQEKLADVLWAINNTCQAYQKLMMETEAVVESTFLEMIRTSQKENVLGDFIKRYSPKRCGDRDLPVLSVTKERAIVFQDERFDSTVASVNKENYLIVPKGYVVQGIHIDEGNFGLQSLVDEGIVSPAYKIWEITSGDIIPELLEYYLRSPRAIDYYTNNFQGTTVKRRQTIKAADLLAMPLNLPDMDGQRKFWEFYLQSEEAKANLLQSINEAKALQRKIIYSKFVLPVKED